MKDEEYVFRASFSVSFRHLAVWGLPGGVLFASILIRFDEGLRFESIYEVVGFVCAVGPVLLIVCLLLVAALTLAFIRLHTTIITPQGIRDCNFWGRWRFVPWHDIRAARLTTLIGLQYVRLLTEDGRLPLSVMLFVENFDEYRAVVLKFAPEGNAFREFLLTYHK